MISVILTTYNYGMYIAQAIDSVIAQTYTNYEIVVVDDGSEDHTRSVVESYLSMPNFKYIYQSNQGQPRAKNRGIVESSGEYVAFLDADDIWLPSKLSRQIHLFNDYGIGVAFSRRKWIDSGGNEIIGNERTLHSGWILDRVFVDNFICFSSTIIRRSYLNQVGFFDESLPMGIDYDLWIRLSAVCKFDFVDEPLVKYRTGHSNLSKNTMKRYDCAQQIMRKNLADHQIRAAMSWYVPALAWADTWSNFGYYLATIGNKKGGFLYALRAIFKFPFYLNAYKRLIKIILV